MDFQKKAVIITGAASGIGLLSAQKFAELGASVTLTDINVDAVTAAADEIRKIGGRALGVQVDVRQYDQVKHAVEVTESEFGSVDILINCAGGASSRVFGRSEGFHELDIEVIDWGIDVNLKGPVYFCHAALAPMIRQGSGVIVNFSSVTGIAGDGWGAIDYSTAKSGLIGLTKSLALYGAPHGVRAVCIAPGPVLTREAMANMKTPLGRAAETQEVVDFVLYLASEKGAFITGSTHLIDGGFCCGGWK
ncbi:MAG TPA: SDR family NAD(P)-dependent oxidoreductase [Capsulimonadaceae bacterium]|jgi:NAD(P)-dependent dehydrogenase (short-subunit alcohol dehydrogenase family)